MPLELQENVQPQVMEDTMSFLVEIFGKRNWKWPPRSTDLIPLDFFLWRYVKNIIYKDAPRSIAKVKKKLMMQLGKSITLCVQVFANFLKRASSCFAIEGVISNTYDDLSYLFVKI